MTMILSEKYVKLKNQEYGPGPTANGSTQRRILMKTIKKLINIIKYFIYGLLSLFVSIRASGLCAFLVRQEFGATPGLMAFAGTFIIFMALFWGLPGLWRRLAYLLDKRKER